MNDHIPSLDARRPLHRKKKQDAANNRPTKYKPAAVVATEARYSRKCLVCTKPTGDSRRYCSSHINPFYKWLECIEPGCELVGERTIPGQTVYRCPDHRTATSIASAPRTQPATDNPGRAAVRTFLDERRRNLARERPIRSLPPRPPYNIGHYDDTRQLPRNPGMGG